MDKFLAKYHRKRKMKTLWNNWDICRICGEYRPTCSIEQHHIHGRKISEEKYPLCLNCHSVITRGQNQLPPKIRACDCLLHIIVFLMRSHGELLKLMGIMQIEFSEKLRMRIDDNNCCEKLHKKERKEKQ